MDVSVRFEGWDAKLGQPTLLNIMRECILRWSGDGLTGIPCAETKRKGESYEKKGESKGDPLENG